MYASMTVALLVFAYGVWRRLRIWRLGRRQVVWDHLGARFRRLLAALLQATVLRRRLPGVMHALVFFGFLVLFGGTLVVFLDSDLGIKLNHGAFYLGFESLTVDLFGGLFLLGLAIAVYRRYLLRPWFLERREPSDALLLVPLLLIALTGFALEGMRLAVVHDRWGGWSPIGLAFSHALAPLGSVAVEPGPWQAVSDPISTFPFRPPISPLRF